ncbi:hypothetical protein GCM10027258_92880 [Amycolatopsis stemonae]
MELVKVIITLTLAALVALVVIVGLIRKTPPMRLLLLLSLELLAVLALCTGNPQLVEDIVKAFVDVFGG